MATKKKNDMCSLHDFFYFSEAQYASLEAFKRQNLWSYLAIFFKVRYFLNMINILLKRETLNTKLTSIKVRNKELTINKTNNDSKAHSY